MFKKMHKKTKQLTIKTKSKLNGRSVLHPSLLDLVLIHGVIV